MEISINKMVNIAARMSVGDQPLPVNEEITYLDDSSSNGFNENKMDDNITEHFLGKYTIL